MWKFSHCNLTYVWGLTLTTELFYHNLNCPTSDGNDYAK